MYCSLPQYEAEPWASGDLYGSRTHITSVKERCLNHLTNRPYWCSARGSNTEPPDLVRIERFELTISIA